MVKQLAKGKERLTNAYWSAVGMASVALLVAMAAAVALATQLRSAGVRTQLYTEQKKFKAKMNYANNLGIPYVVFLGEDEIRDGIVACKDMESGEQTNLPYEATLSRIRDGIARRNAGHVILEK